MIQLLPSEFNEFCIIIELLTIPLNCRARADDVLKRATEVSNALEEAEQAQVTREQSFKFDRELKLFITESSA